MPRRPDLAKLGPKRKNLNVKFTREGHYGPMVPMWHIEDGASASDLRLVKDFNSRDLGKIVAPEHFVEAFSYILAIPVRDKAEILEQRKAIAELRDSSKRQRLDEVISEMYKLEKIYDAMNRELEDCCTAREGIERKLQVLEHYVSIVDGLDSLSEGAESQPMRELSDYIRQVRDSKEMLFVPETVERGTKDRAITFELRYNAGGNIHSLRTAKVERAKPIPVKDILRSFGDNMTRVPLSGLLFRKSIINEVLSTLIEENWPNMAKTVSLLPDLEFYRAAGVYEDKIAGVEGGVAVPEFVEGRTEIDNLGHPIILLSGEPVVRNDYHMNGQNLMLITGANNSGKTFYSKSVGLAHLLAQRGMSIPATSARMRVADGVYTHFVDQDDPLTGQGRYKFELTRMAEILDNCSRNSLVIVDEPCGGTEPEQGQVQSSYFLEALADAGIQTLFTTHYHDLARMTASDTRIKSMHPYTEKQNGQMIYTHKLREGAAGTSMALELAQSLNLGRDELMARARRIKEKD